MLFDNRHASCEVLTEKPAWKLVLFTFRRVEASVGHWPVMTSCMQHVAPFRLHRVTMHIALGGHSWRYEILYTKNKITPCSRNVSIVLDDNVSDADMDKLLYWAQRLYSTIQHYIDVVGC